MGLQFTMTAVDVGQYNSIKSVVTLFILMLLDKVLVKEILLL